MKEYLIALITLPLCFCFNFVQAQSDAKKKIEKEVKVTVDDQSGKMTKTIKMKIKDGDGEEKIMIWTGTDEEEMSDEMKEHMEDVQIIVKNGKTKQKNEIEKEISITIDDENGEMTKTIEVTSDENGEKKVMQWQGGENDEMPEEIKKLMKDVEVIVIDDKNKTSSKIIKKEKKINYKIIEDGNEERIIEWNGEGEMPTEIKEKLEKEGVEIKGGNVMIFRSDEDSEDNVVIMRQGSNSGTHTFISTDQDSGSKPRLGIMIENHIDGIEVKEVETGSVAEKNGLQSGDIIFKIDDKYIGSTLQLIDYLDKAAEGIQVKLKVLRDGSEKTLKLNLD